MATASLIMAAAQKAEDMTPPARTFKNGHVARHQRPSGSSDSLLSPKEEAEAGDGQWVSAGGMTSAAGSRAGMTSGPSPMSSGSVSSVAAAVTRRTMSAGTSVGAGPASAGRDSGASSSRRRPRAGKGGRQHSSHSASEVLRSDSPTSSHGDDGGRGGGSGSKRVFHNGTFCGEAKVFEAKGRKKPPPKVPR